MTVLRLAASVLLVALLASPALGTVGPSPDPVAASAKDLRSVGRFVAGLERDWRTFDAACTTDAPFALTYLITSRAVRDHVAASYFDDNAFVATWDLVFAGYYTSAIDARMHDRAASAVWREAFAWGDGGRSSVLEDVMLGMSAHINYDLALATYEAGLVRDGRKADFDRINDVLATVIRDVTTELARHYDPSFAPGAASDLSDPAMLQLIFEWRENAWWSATRLSNAATPFERELVRQEIQTGALLAAQAFEIPKPATTEDRVAFCTANP